MVPSSSIRNISTSDAAALFQRYGLRRNGVSSAFASLPASSRLRLALEELGGVYLAFGRFLMWRADMLRSDILLRLRDLRHRSNGVRRADVEALLRDQCPGKTVALEPEPCWSTTSRSAFRGRYLERNVVVQVALPPPPPKCLAEFRRNIVLIDEEFLRTVLSEQVFRQFESWLGLTADLARERSYLESLSTFRDRGLVEYPRIVPDLCGRDLLTFEWIDGEPLATGLSKGAPDAVRRAAECIIEQICVLSAIDADFDPAAYVIKPNGKLAARFVERFVAVPPALTSACLKYLSSVLSADAPAAAHLLIKLAYGRTALHLESSLLDELSNLEPELKVNLQFPDSVSVFEANWRALKRIDLDKPLYLDAMHRNLVAAGYWNSEVVLPKNGPLPDLVAEAQWPVLRALLSSRATDLFSRDMASDWAIGTGLLLFESIRQANRMADQFRQNEVSLGVDLQTSSEHSKKLHKAIRFRVFVGMLLIIFLIALRVAFAAPAPWNTVGSAVAVCGGVALFWFVSRLE